MSLSSVYMLSTPFPLLRFLFRLSAVPSLL